MAGGQSLIPVLKLRFASAARARRHQPHPGARPHRPRTPAGSRSAPSSATPTRDDRRSCAERYGAPRRRRAADLRPDRPQPRHDLGSLAHADPQGDWGSALHRRPRPRRRSVARAAGRGRSPLDELFQGPFTTSLEPDEIAHGGPGARSRPADRRHLPQARAQDRRLRDRRRRGPPLPSTTGSVGQVGIGAHRSRPDEPARDGRRGGARRRRATDDTIREAAAAAAEAAQPRSDHRGSADYKTERRPRLHGARASEAIRRPRPAAEDADMTETRTLSTTGAPPYPGHRER